MITGKQNPLVGITEYYKINDVLGSNIFSGDNVQYFWYLWRKQKDGKWLDITKKDPKRGLQVTYKFGETFLGTQFKIQVFKATKNGLTKKFEAKLFAELLIVPTSNKIAQIERVVLFNGGASDVNKAHYRDTLTARAYCTAMFNQTVEFHLWEDDAPKGGHNPAINQHNRYNVPFPAKVNEKGIAEVQIKLVSHESILKNIANKYVMKGDKNEGKNHEFYVTASYSGKIKNSSQVNVDVANPDYKKDSPKSQPKAPAKKPEQKKTNPQPRQDTYKKPLPNNKPATGKNNQSDKDGRIIDVSFKNRAGKKFTTTPKFGETIIVEILTKNVIGKNYYLRVWEDDTFGKHDLLYEGIHRIDSDQQLVTFALTKGRQQIGEIGNDPKNTDSGEYTMEWKEHQELFAEIAFSDISKESTRLTVEVLEEYKSPEYKKAAAKVKMLPKKENKGTCICQEQYKDLVWGGKVSCDFRKKVVEICTQLWPAKPMEMANGLMAVMKVETDGSFKAHQIMGKSLKDVNSITKDDFWLITKDKKTGKEKKTSRAVGLIQFTQAALQAIGEFTAGSGFDKLHEVKLRFAKMGEVNQLDYVKKYFEPSKNKIKTPEDIYLHVFAPKGVAQKDDYVLYEKGTEEYRQNKSVDEENNNNDKIERSEILGRYKISMNEGNKQQNKAQTFSCSGNVVSSSPKPANSTDKDMLSKYLSYQQAIKSDTAKKHKLDNSPNAAEIENLKHLGTNIYDKIYEKFNGNVKLTSVFRNGPVNKKVGGSSTSQHRFGQALDIQGTNGVTNKQIFKYVKDNLDYHQIIWEFGSTTEPNWVHVGYKPSGNRKTNTRAKKVNGSTQYVTFDLNI